MIDLARQDVDATMGYGLEPENTQWPTASPQEGDWSARNQGHRTVLHSLTDDTEDDVTEQVQLSAARPAPADRGDFWFYGAYRRFHAGLEPEDTSPGTWRDHWRGATSSRSSGDAVDHDLKAEAQRVLRAEAAFSTHFLQVRCRGGEITLAGTVPDRGAKRLAESLVERLAGVRDVHNRLRVG
ncbi:MAG: BON domain-containing protein [Myxococcota bacterium]